MKYNLTFWQYIQLYLFVFPAWLSYDGETKNRKSWHEVKKGMEKHTCHFKIYEPYIYKGVKYDFWRCDHEGCYFCSPDQDKE